jgi:hypothetical protein
MKQCAECRYLREERAGIHEYDGKLSRAEAEKVAAAERCEKCKWLPTEGKQAIKGSRQGCLI